jgi:hypothetical protein
VTGVFGEGSALAYGTGVAAVSAGIVTLSMRLWRGGDVTLLK